ALAKKRQQLLHDPQRPVAQKAPMARSDCGERALQTNPCTASESPGVQTKPIEPVARRKQAEEPGEKKRRTRDGERKSPKRAGERRQSLDSQACEKDERGDVRCQPGSEFDRELRFALEAAKLGPQCRLAE